MLSTSCDLNEWWTLPYLIQKSKSFWMYVLARKLLNRIKGGKPLSGIKHGNHRYENSAFSTILCSSMKLVLLLECVCLRVRVCVKVLSRVRLAILPPSLLSFPDLPLYVSSPYMPIPPLNSSTPLFGCLVSNASWGETSLSGGASFREGILSSIPDGKLQALEARMTGGNSLSGHGLHLDAQVDESPPHNFEHGNSLKRPLTPSSNQGPAEIKRMRVSAEPDNSNGSRYTTERENNNTSNTPVVRYVSCCYLPL
jgi:hypothetical protein